ncbi:MAG: beta-N-acetylhexosaminidase [Alphaproteobacteria bacterium]|nr:beta-N-acetylhexosaminidase [Alphaproteobacteria bacterium]
MEIQGLISLVVVNNTKELEKIRSSTIFGCSGLTLTTLERDFFKSCQPLGFILFARNCKNPDQVRDLVQSLKDTVHHKDVPILIDQEGGRVVRLTPPVWRRVPPASVFGKMTEQSRDLAGECVFENAVLIATELRDLGITVNCAPCVDLLFTKDVDPIIGDRAFSSDPEIVAYLSLKMIDAFQSQGIVPVIKHLPGHGRAPVDSHLELPVVTNEMAELNETDFRAFRLICENNQTGKTPWGMTAHVVYSALGDSRPATLSDTIINTIIRQTIGFQGFLLSDDLAMKALSGSFKERTQSALNAGCDAVLHCNGNLDEMMEIAAAARSLSSESFDRFRESFPV